MTSEQPRPRPRFNRLLALSTAVALAAGVWLLVEGTRTEHPPQPTVADAFHGASQGPATGATPSLRPAVQALAPSVPVQIRIPEIGVKAPLVPLGLDSQGHLDVPPDDNQNLAGWYSEGPTPGTAGNAVIDGHVDTVKGPAVFYGLGALHKGDTIDVDRRDGTSAVFGIDAIEVYGKTGFPDQKVYGATADPELRVITCGGGFSGGHYLGNVVVYAHLLKGAKSPA